MLPRDYRLKKRIAFTATYKTGKSTHNNGITMFYGKEKQEGKTKIGFVVSKKIHKRAVKRNRIKRLMRESVRLYIKISGNNFDTKYKSLIFVASARLLNKDFQDINTSIQELMDGLK